MQLKLLLLIIGIVLLVVGIAGNIYWTQQNKDMDKEKCFMINYWMYVGLSGIGLLLALVAGVLYWWASRKGGSGSGQYGYGQIGGGLFGDLMSFLGGQSNQSYGFGYFEE